MVAGKRHRADFLIIHDFNSVSNLRALRDLLRAFNKYHVKDVESPSLKSLTSGRYKALAYSELTPTGVEWKIAFLFRVGKDRHNPGHVIVSVDYVLVDPSSRMTFAQVGKFVRLISQYVMKRLDGRPDATTIDLLINLDNQLNPHVHDLIVNALKAEGMRINHDKNVGVKRIKSVDPSTGRNVVNLPLPDVDPARVRGMVPVVQSRVYPIDVGTGHKVQFVAKIRRGSDQHKALLNFCLKHQDWTFPSIGCRTSYMETLFTGERGDIPRWVDSMVEDAHFIVIVDEKGRIEAFMAFIAGYSMPSVSTWTGKGNRSTGIDGYYVPPDRTIFVPILVCECNPRGANGHRGKPGVWTQKGFQQALALWKMLLTVLSDPSNKSQFSMIAAQTSWDSLHAHLLDALGMSVRTRFSNLPYYQADTTIFARMVS